MSRWRNAFSRWRKRDPDPRHALGRRGEREAARWLRSQGWKILHRNFRAPRGGEVDLVCRHGKVLVFVEVKTRAARSELSRPADAVNLEKQALVSRGAVAWLRMLGQPDVPFRFDIVEVILPPGGKPEIERIEAAFALPEPWRW